MSSLIAWFEIPATDINRAAQFYGALLATDLSVLDLGALKMVLLPEGGALVQHPTAYHPSHEGPLLYLDGGDDMTELLSRVEIAGGRIIREKTQVSPSFGYMALFEDTEGNRLAIRSLG
ncbi:VOC family protein [Telluribacter sp. SYSU D00476]|uniref:VOC family protein n=1 Tax=Telluribacter sp. SYSU D00476 TaxID=2811430 RepID=UPI001FF324C5|nr:VOC family protein [Telluribacter sp. SYSU D00476]